MTEHATATDVATLHAGLAPNGVTFRPLRATRSSSPYAYAVEWWGDLVGREHVLAQVVVHEGGGQVVLRLPTALLGELAHQGGEGDAGLHEGGHDVLAAHHLGVARTEAAAGLLRDAGLVR